MVSSENHPAPGGGLSMAEEVSIEVRAQVLGICTVLAFVAALAAFASPAIRGLAGGMAVAGYTAFAGRLHLLRQIPQRHERRSVLAMSVWPLLAPGVAAVVALICGASGNLWALVLLAVVFIAFEVKQFPRRAAKPH